MKTRYTGQRDDEELRNVMGDTLARLFDQDPDVMFLDCDTMTPCNMLRFKERYPNRIISCGIAEANMIGVAAGLSKMGKKPYVHSFGPFATRRCFDQIFLSVGYAGNNIRIIGTDPGIAAAYNGGTHMPFEDIALMRMIPNAVVVEPTDAVMMQSILCAAKDLPGVTYIRTYRKNAVSIYQAGTKFLIGGGKLLRDGSDLTIFTGGLLVSQAMEAAKKAAENGLSVQVVDLYSIKPIDEQLILACASKTRRAITAENHNVIGGLGSAVAEVLAEHFPIPLKRIGIRESYGEVGSEKYLLERFGLTSHFILQGIQELLSY